MKKNYTFFYKNRTSKFIFLPSSFFFLLIMMFQKMKNWARGSFSILFCDKNNNKIKEILKNEEINLSKSNCDSGCKVRKLSFNCAKV